MLFRVEPIEIDLELSAEVLDQLLSRQPIGPEVLTQSQRCLQRVRRKQKAPSQKDSDIPIDHLRQVGCHMIWNRYPQPLPSRYEVNVAVAVPWTEQYQDITRVLAALCYQFRELGKIAIGHCDDDRTHVLGLDRAEQLKCAFPIRGRERSLHGRMMVI